MIFLRCSNTVSDFEINKKNNEITNKEKLKKIQRDYLMAKQTYLNSQNDENFKKYMELFKSYSENLKKTHTIDTATQKLIELGIPITSEYFQQNKGINSELNKLNQDFVGVIKQTKNDIFRKYNDLLSNINLNFYDGNSVFQIKVIDQKISIENLQDQNFTINQNGEIKVNEKTTLRTQKRNTQLTKR